MDTLTLLGVYPLEVVKTELADNAPQDIVFDSHPGGVPAPSEAVQRLAQTLALSLRLVDIKLNNQSIIAAVLSYCFDVQGML